MKKIIIFLMAFAIGSLNSGKVQAANPENVDIHGFISQGYLQTSKNNYLAETEDGSFQFNEMGINFTTSPSDKLTIGCQFFARDLGDVGNDEILINWAFADYKWREWLGLRAGLIKSPFGFYNDTRDMDMLRTPIFLPSGVYNEWFRDGINSIKGAEIYGNIAVGFLGTLKYQFQIGEMQIPLDSGTTKFIKEINGVYDVMEIDVNKIYSSKLEWKTPLDGLRLGVTNFITDLTQEWKLASDSGNDASFNNKDLKFFVYSAEYTWGDLVVAVEKYIMKRDADLTMHLDATWAPLILKTPGALAGDYTVPKDLISDTTYCVSASYRFTDLLELGTYYSYYENDPDSEFATETAEQQNELTDICLSARFDINDNWIVKLEAHKMDGLFGVAPEEDGTFDNDWNFFAAKVTFSF